MTVVTGSVKVGSQTLTPTGSVTLPTSSQTVTHGEQLTINHVGPWTLQQVSKGTEALLKVPVPSRGYWKFDTPSEWAPSGAYVNNNLASNKGGVVPAGGLTIDGYQVPAGTIVAQFRDFSGSDFSAQGQSGSYLFRGCRFRNGSIGQSSQFNDFQSTYTNRMFYCDMGSPTTNLSDWEGSFWKAIGGQNHVMLRNYCSWQYVTFQPNVDGCQFVENLVENLIYWGGESGPPGQAGVPLHMACIGSEGGRKGFRIIRNKIRLPSPDATGQAFVNGAAIAFEGTNGGKYTDCQVVDNYLSGFNYVILDFGEVAGSTSIVITGNKVTTQWFPNGGRSGCEQAGPKPPVWGSNGNVKSGNVWADGPKAGTVAF